MSSDEYLNGIEERSRKAQDATSEAPTSIDVLDGTTVYGSDPRYVPIVVSQEDRDWLAERGMAARIDFDSQDDVMTVILASEYVEHRVDICADTVRKVVFTTFFREALKTLKETIK